MVDHAQKAAMAAMKAIGRQYLSAGLVSWRVTPSGEMRTRWRPAVVAITVMRSSAAKTRNSR